MGLLLRRSDGFSEVTRAWEDQVVIVIGGGPSLTPEQIERVGAWRERERIRCIAVNDAYLIAPFSDLLYFADGAWWRWHAQGIPRLKLGMTRGMVREAFEDFRGERCSLESSRAMICDERVHFLRNRDRPHHRAAISTEPDRVGSGRHSGFQALNVAILSGARRVALIGFDGRPNPLDGETHWHGGHLTTPHPAAWDLIQRSFNDARDAIAATGVDVVNCSPGSAINAFRAIALEQVLEETA